PYTTLFRSTHSRRTVRETTIDRVVEIGTAGRSSDHGEDLRCLQTGNPKHQSQRMGQLSVRKPATSRRIVPSSQVRFEHRPLCHPRSRTTEKVAQGASHVTKDMLQIPHYAVCNGLSSQRRQLGV